MGGVERALMDQILIKRIVRSILFEGGSWSPGVLLSSIVDLSESLPGAEDGIARSTVEEIKKLVAEGDPENVLVISSSVTNLVRRGVRHLVAAGDQISS